MIQCNEIDQTVNQLLAAFQDCKKINPADLTLLVELVAAVQVCANGGTAYDVLNEDIYEPLTNQVVTYDVGSYHSISVMILEGTITRNGVTYPTGSVLDHEVTNTNQIAFTFTVNAGAKVVVQTLTETPT